MKILANIECVQNVIYFGIPLECVWKINSAQNQLKQID